MHKKQGGFMGDDRRFYCIYQRYNYNGNDISFLKQQEKMDCTAKNFTWNLDQAALYGHDTAAHIVANDPNLEMVLWQDAHRIATMHAPAGKLKNIPLKHGDVCLKLSKRDQCGHNASFWFFNHLGYTSDYRCAQVFIYREGAHVREFEYYVKLSKVAKVSEKRVDIQDLNDVRDREAHHSISYCNKLIKIHEAQNG